MAFPSESLSHQSTNIFACRPSQKQGRLSARNISVLDALNAIRLSSPGSRVSSSILSPSTLFAHRSPMRSKASSITTEFPRMTCVRISLIFVYLTIVATYDLSDPLLLSIGLLLNRVVEHYVEENLSSRELSAIHSLPCVKARLSA